MTKPEFKKIRTITVTKTHVETLYKHMQKCLQKETSQEERLKIQEILNRIEAQTRFKQTE